MIEIKMVVYDAIELNMLAQLQQMLELKRQQGAQGAQGGQGETPPRDEGVSSGTSIAHDALTAIAEIREEASSFHQASTLDGNEHVVNAAVPAPVPSDIEVARAITVYSQKAGVPKARELIESFGVKNAMAVPDERRAEFIAATVAHVEGL